MYVFQSKSSSKRARKGGGNTDEETDLRLERDESLAMDCGIDLYTEDPENEDPENEDPENEYLENVVECTECTDEAILSAEMAMDRVMNKRLKKQGCENKRRRFMNMKTDVLVDRMKKTYDSNRRLKERLEKNKEILGLMEAEQSIRHIG